MIAEILLLTLFAVLIPFTLNFIGIGPYVPVFVQGSGAFYLSSLVTLRIVEELDRPEYIISGVLVLFIFGFFSRKQDSSEGRSELRAEIQGIGIYAFVCSLVLAFM